MKWLCYSKSSCSVEWNHPVPSLFGVKEATHFLMKLSWPLVSHGNMLHGNCNPWSKWRNATLAKRVLSDVNCPQCPLAALHSYSDALVFINHKLLLLGVYFCSGLTSQPRPQSRCKAAAEELPEYSPTIASHAVKVTPVLWQSCHAVKGLPGHSHIPDDK